MPADKRPRGPRILRFLDDHRLDHTPANYAFVHRFLVEEDVALKAEVERIIDGGLRISPDAVAELTGGCSTETSGEHEAVPQLDQLTLHVLDIIGDAARATGHFNRDLVSAAALLLGSDGEGVRSIVSAMIERTARAEASLADTMRQARSLREELNAIRSDANRDRLTGLLNRAGMEELLAIAVGLAKGCAVAFVDIDHFKAVNDGHGHAVGDRVLQAVATELAQSCQPHPVARWGGEEFLILMENMTAAEAGPIIDAARTNVAKRRLVVRETDAPLGAITFSAGVSASRGRSVPELVASADELLYRAKNAGRNRIEME